MAEYLRRQKLAIPSKNPFVDAVGIDLGELLGACRFWMPGVREQAGQKSLCRCSLWWQNS